MTNEFLLLTLHLKDKVMALNQNENLGPMKLIFNYNNIFYSFFYDDISGCIHRSREYALNYVYSGEMILDNGVEKIHVRKGECVFIPRDHHITMYKKTYQGERYCGIFLMFTRSFLRDMYSKLSLNKVKATTDKLPEGVIKLPRTVELASLFASMTPYFDPEVKPKEDFMELKLQEGLMALLAIEKRLEKAYELMKTGKKKVVDVYAEVGFRNPSHFSTAFKKEFGITPTAVMG